MNAIICQILPIDGGNLSSVAGIIVVTTFLMQYIKQWVGTVDYLKKVPTFMYVLAVSLLLTVIANKYMHTLSGSLPQLLYSTASAALAASGFYQWMKDGMAGIEETHPDFKKANDTCLPQPTETVQHIIITAEDFEWPSIKR